MSNEGPGESGVFVFADLPGRNPGFVRSKSSVAAPETHSIRIVRDVFRERHHWFEKSAEPTSVLWWVEDGHQPDLVEAGERLAHLRKFGASDEAFDLPTLHA